MVLQSSLDAFMPHKISQKRNVVTPFKETFRKAMSEGMRIDDSRVDAVAYRQLLKLPRDSARSNAVTVFVQENEAAYETLHMGCS